MSFAYGGSLLLPLQAFSEPTFGATGPLSVDDRFSILANQFLPDFVVDDHPTFVSFIKAFLEYTEQNGNVRAEAVRLNTYTDLDQTLESFKEHFKNTYLQNFPKDFLSTSNEDLALKRIKDYYKNKGNSEAIQFLFRLLFDKEASVEYLRDRILKLSDSDYSNSLSILCSVSNQKSTVYDYIGKRVFQRQNEFDGSSQVYASANIDDIIFRVDGATKVDYAELILKDRVGEFLPNRTIIFEDTSDGKKSIKETVFSLVSEVKPAVVDGVTQDGRGYAINDIVLLKENNKIVSKLKVKEISSIGEIVSITKPLGKPVRIFTTSENLSVDILTSGGTGASLDILGNRAEVVDEVIFKSPRSQLSSKSVIQNNFNYQQFSYTISAEKSLRDYAAIIKKLFHPAGSMMLGRYVTTQNIQATGITTNVTTIENVKTDKKVTALIGNYLPYTIDGTADFRGDTLGGSFGDFYPDGWGGITPSTLTFSGSTPDVAPNLIFPNTSQIVPVGNGIYGGDENTSPEYINSGLVESQRKFGYVVAPKTQIPMTTSDVQKFGQGFSGGYIVYRHPRVLFKENRTNDELSKVNNKYEFATSRNKVRIRFDKVLMTISGISGSISVNDELSQTIPGQMTAFGTVESIETKDFSKTPAAKISNVKKAKNKATLNPLLATTLSVGSGTPGFSSVVLTVLVKSGNFTSQKNIKVFAQDGDSFDIVGNTDATSLPIDSTQQQDMEFGDVRISDFFDKMSVPNLNT